MELNPSEWQLVSDPFEPLRIFRSRIPFIAEEGAGSTKQIDVVCKETFKMGVGSSTAMNLAGGNPITAVGLDNYTSKINSWYRTPQSLKDKVAQKANWDVAARGEVVEVRRRPGRRLGGGGDRDQQDGRETAPGVHLARRNSSTFA